MNEALPYGRSRPWLRAEFGWTERTARNFMAVTERFGTKTEIISELTIYPTAAYLLASGERITSAVARHILGKLRHMPVRQARSQSNLPDGKLLGQLLEPLESLRQRWNPGQLSALARQLREFADSLEEQ